MPDDLFYQCKTATKFREYAACRIAGIYSDVETYRDCVTGGVTGLLVRTLANPANPGNPVNLVKGDAWVAAMDRLIRDRALRRSIQDRAYACVRERYAPGRFEQRWLAQIEEVAGQRVAARRSSRMAHVTARPAGPGVFAGALLRQMWRYVARVPAVLQQGGLKKVWARTRG